MASSDLMIGFSTGALAKGDFRAALATARELCVEAIELSALRLPELAPLTEFIRTTELTDFEYVSVHAPSEFSSRDEERVIEQLLTVTRGKQWPVILHPDAIHNIREWRALGEFLYIENMDKRKPSGRTVEELRGVLDQLPDAKLCFDIAHARQVDSSMTEAYRILRAFGDRVRQVHISEVNSRSAHDRISASGVRAFRQVIEQVPEAVPVILETPVTPAQAASEIEKVRELFAGETVH